jgi:outer membrane protein with beta-barrel domain
MLRKGLMLCAVMLLGVGTALAQETRTGAGRYEIGAFPGGGMFFTESSKAGEPDFGNYALGASFTFNIHRLVGIEGEGGGLIGLHQNFAVGNVRFADQQTPHMWSYSGNVVVHPWGSDRPIVPYATGGLGALTLSPKGEADKLDITTYETYLMGNLGGGVKWFSARHFGVRGDYRFMMVDNKNDAPAFFGTENRYGHRVQAGFILTY